MHDADDELRFEEKIRKFAGTAGFDPEFCVKCGYCKTSCPTYLAVRSEDVSPRGRLALTKARRITPEIFASIDTCTKCFECEVSCPVGLKPWRAFLDWKSETTLGKVEKFFAKLTVSSSAVARLLYRFAVLSNRSKALGKARRKFRKVRREFVERFKKVFVESGVFLKPDTQILFFSTCFGRTTHKLWTDIALAILDAIGVRYEVVKGCCGAPLFFAGGFSELPKFSFSFPLVVVGDTCAWVLRNVHGVNCVEFSDFLAGLTSGKKVSPLKTKTEFFIHNSCHEKDGVGALKSKLFEVLGIEFSETDFPCCGFGGSLFFKSAFLPFSRWRKMSVEVGLEFCKSIPSDATVITNSAGCYMQISRFKKVLWTGQLFVEYLFPGLFLSD